MDFFYSSQEKFSAFSMQHLSIIVISVLFGIALFAFANKYLDENKKRRLGFVLSIIPLITVLLRMLVEYRMGMFTYMEDLPLFICRIVSFILPVLFINQSKALFGVLYFWIMAGVSNAVLTPDLKFGLPHFESIFYWVIHIGLLIAILYTVFVFKWIPKRKDVMRAFLWANVYLLIVHAINWILGSNYSFTMHKPINGSVLDFFGPWPVYLLTGQFLALILFVLFYLPFLPSEKSKLS